MPLNNQWLVAGAVIAVGLGGYAAWKLGYLKLGGGGPPPCNTNILLCNTVDVSRANVPVAGVAITITYAGMMFTQVSDSNGLAQFCNIPSGFTINLTASKAGYQTFNNSFSMYAPIVQQAVLML